jgi:hypothetical protein
VAIVYPPAHRKDFNDLLQARRAAA